MKIINNKRGSAILWTILMTVILTILLGSVLTASYTYFNYTVNVVKKQQAYYTARSAMNAVLQQFASYDQEHETQTGSIYTYSSSNNPIMPQKGETVTIKDFSFKSDLKMGTAVATLTLNEDDEEMVDISVTSTYLDKEYTMKATVARQPIYFGGVALKNLQLSNNSTFTLGQNTDLYWYTFRNDNASTGSGYDASKVQPFNTVTGTAGITVTDKNGKAQTVGKLVLEGNSKIKVQGNLITQGDAILNNKIEVAGQKFNSAVKYNSSHNKTIWSSTQYIISNKTMEVQEDLGYYSTGSLDIFTNLTDIVIKACNNTKGNMKNAFGANVSDSMNRLINFVNGIMPSNINTFLSENNITSLSAYSDKDDALNIQYIYIASLSNLISNAFSDSALLEPFVSSISSSLNQNLYKVRDISYVDMSASSVGNTGDTGITPVTYLVVEGNKYVDDGLYVRIKYGISPTLSSSFASVLKSVRDTTSASLGSNIASLFGVASKSSCVVVYLGRNATLELGGGVNTKAMPNTRSGSDPACTKENQVFFYTIYGDEGSKVILNDGVTLIGECMCDNLQIKGDVKIVYSSTNGSQVAKQKVAEYWTVINYSD